MAVEAFTVIRQAMEKAGKVSPGPAGHAPARERLMALEARGKGILAYSLRSNREVKDAADVFGSHPRRTERRRPWSRSPPRSSTSSPGPFDPSKFNDRYEDALRALITREGEGPRREEGRGAQGGRGRST